MKTPFPSRKASVALGGHRDVADLEAEVGD
jgi:hypothetical protein